MRSLMRPSLAALALLVAVSAAVGSSGSFEITGVGITLGKAEQVVENQKAQPPRFSAKVEKGKTFTLIATGMAYGRGDAKGSAFKPESGAWTFDDKNFKKAEPDKKAEKAQVVIALTPTTLGKSRVRFSGKVLGYERTFDVMVEVVEPKKK